MKEKSNREIRVVMQPSLYEKFKDKCESDYKTVSETIRELIVKYLREDN